MNNTVLKIIAGILLLGAIGVAYVGIQLSREPARQPTPVAAPAQPASVPTENVVVAARAIRKGQALGVADSTSKDIPAPPMAVYRDTQDVFGKVALSDIPAGTPLTPAMFATDSMASLLLVGERAIAVQVDEVVGVGGYAKPGDRVDVLAYFPPNKETRQQSITRIIVHDAALLAFGETNRIDEDQHKRTQNEATGQNEAKAGNVAEEVKNRRQGLRSAVLAIREEDVTRLMLGASSGQLRLALRPQVTRRPDPLSIYGKDKADKNIPPAEEAARTLTISDIAGGARSGPGIIIQEGSKERTLDDNTSESKP